MTNKAPELLPCPFCGGEAEMRERMDENIWDHSTVKWVSVGCKNIDCDLQGFDWPEDVEPNAVALWNTRADQQAIEAAREEGRRAGLEEAREEVIAKIEDCRKMQANYFQRGQDAQGYHAEAAKVVLSATEAAILALTEQEGE